ncbi:hypothetical protein AB0M45_21430 [Nocardia sp. NPDC051787]|uniref:hypothetical protein n=1 Tax=Nocardia sp. NPDC051787 TaxID=3155415 RepID=UPI00341EF7FB
MGYEFTVEFEALFGARRPQFINLGVPAADLDAAWARIAAMWADGPGGWAFGLSAAGELAHAPVLLASGGLDTWKMGLHPMFVTFALGVGVNAMVFDPRGTGETAAAPGRRLRLSGGRGVRTGELPAPDVRHERHRGNTSVFTAPPTEAKMPTAARPAAITPSRLDPFRLMGLDDVDPVYVGSAGQLIGEI